MAKSDKLANGSLHSSFVVCATLLLGSCNPDPRETQINSRLRSPDQRREAIYAEDLSGGAATGVSEDIYIVEPARVPRIADRVFSRECVRDVQIAWEGPKILRISYTAAAGLHYAPKPDAPFIWAPWLWHNSAASAVQVRVVQSVVPGNSC
jgi:hypothetical protein